MNNQRKKWLDIARGICILCMIACHAISSSDNYNDLMKILSGISGTWFLVFFFFSSGMCFSMKTTYKKFMIKQFKKLVVPYGCCTVAYFLYQLKIIGIYGNFSRLQKIKYAMVSIITSLPAAFKDISFVHTETIGVGPIWFFTCLFVSYAMYGILYKFKYRLTLIVILAAIATWTQTFCILPFTIQDACIGCMFICFGNVFKEQVFSFVDRLFKKNIVQCLGGVIVVFILQLILIYLLFSKFSFFGFDLGSNRYNFISLPVTLLGFIFVIAIAVFIERTQIFDDYLAFCGKESFYIVILHNIDILMVREWYMRDSSFLIGTMLLYPFCIYIYQRFKERYIYPLKK